MNRTTGIAPRAGVWALCVMSVALVLLMVRPALGQDFKGKFTNPRVTLELDGPGPRYTGKLTVRGRTHPVAASEKDGKLEGHFIVEETQFALEATLDGEKLLLFSGGSRQELVRERPAGPINPLTGLPEIPPVAPPAETGPPSADPAVADAVADAAIAAERQRSLAAMADLGPVQADPRRDWTIVVYMAADNDLEQFGLIDLNEMEAGLPDKGVDVIVLIDRAKGYDDSDGDWTDSRVYRVVRDGDMNKINSTILARPGEINMGDPEVLGTFAGAALKTFPARHYKLVMWNHGGGWPAMCNDHDAPGADGGHDELTMPEMREGVEMALKIAGLEKLDIIGFDMCLMGQLDVVAEISHLADVMIASQALEPGDGWPYDALLPQFGKGNIGSRRLASEIVRAFDGYYRNRREKDTTLSAIDLALTEEVIQSLNAIVDKCLPDIENHWTAINRSIFYAEAYQERSEFRRGPQSIASYDLLDILKRMDHSMDDFPARAEFRQFVQLMDRYIISSVNSDLRKLSTGVAIYAPVRGQQVNPDYRMIRMASESRWLELLKKVHELQERDVQPPKFSNFRAVDAENKPLKAAMPLAEHKLHFDLEGENIVWTQSWLGMKDRDSDDTLVLAMSFVWDPTWLERIDKAVAHEVDLLMPEYKDGVNNLTETFDGLTLTITNGDEHAAGTIDGTNVDDMETWQIPALYQHASVAPEAVQCVIHFNNSVWNATRIIGEFPQPDGSVMMRMIRPEADAQITPLFLTLRADGSTILQAGGTLKWGRGLNLVMIPTPPGKYEAVLVAETMGDARTTARFAFEVEENPNFKPFLAGWQHYRPGDLAGTWDHSLVTDRGAERTGTAVTIQATDEENLYHVQLEDAAKEVTEMLWIVELRGMPHIRMLEIVAGKHEGTILAPSFYNVVEGKAKLVSALTNLDGRIILWEKREPAEAGRTIDAERFNPVEVPDPQPVRMR